MAKILTEQMQCLFFSFIKNKILKQTLCFEVVFRDQDLFSIDKVLLSETLGEQGAPQENTSLCK